MLGAKDVAFPKLNLASSGCISSARSSSVSSIAFGGLDTGWTFYTPYSTAPVDGTTTYHAMGG
jgi:cytochrome c oxidase subunit 1